MQKPTHRRRGAVLIWVVISLLVLVGFVGLGTDVGWLVLSAQQLQTGADASSLAAAQLVKIDQVLARDAALDVAGKNKAAADWIGLDRNDSNDPLGDIVIGRYDQIANTFDPTTTSPNAVKVVARRTEAHSNGLGGVPMTFGRAFNVDTVDLQRYAIAINGGGTGAGLIVLDPTANCALSIGGNGTINVSGGDVQVNSNNSCATCSTGNSAQLDAPNLNVVGGNCISTGVYNGTVNSPAPSITDPLVDLPEPTIGGMPVRSVDTNGNDSIQPGYYPAGIRRNGSGTLNMAPGVYAVGGQGFSVTGTAALIGNGVMVYVAAGPVDLTGNGAITMAPLNPVDYPAQNPDATTYEHVTIFQGRDNTTDSEIQGTNQLHIAGTLYFPSNHLRITGTGNGIGNQLIVDTLTVWGNGDVTINYDGSFPAPGNRVFLVE